MTETMTQQEALKEARRRWDNGWVFDRMEDALPYQREVMDNSIKRVGRFWVGQRDFGPAYGNGDTWEAAFADSERKEKHG